MKCKQTVKGKEIKKENLIRFKNCCQVTTDEGGGRRWEEFFGGNDQFLLIGTLNALM